MSGIGHIAAAPAVDTARRLYPGAALCTVLALAASFLAEHYGAPALLLALLLGCGFSAQAGEERLADGVDFCAQTLLRIGVALLGARIALGDLREAGLVPLGVVVVVVPGILATALLLGRWLRLPTLHSLVAGSAVAICGVSAAVAVAAALPRGRLEERRLLGIVAGVPALGSLAMALYPMLTAGLGYSDTESGIFLGATIHDVAQAAGAGYLVSPAAGDVATVTKLLRVAALAPLVLLLGFLMRRGESGNAPLPLFLFGFVALLALNSLGWLPESLRTLLVDASGWCLLVTMAALGLRTSLPGLVRLGWRPLAHLVALSLVLAAAVAGLLALA